VLADQGVRLVVRSSEQLVGVVLRVVQERPPDLGRPSRKATGSVYGVGDPDVAPIDPFERAERRQRRTR
jgi:hypothetical protein